MLSFPVDAPIRMIALVMLFVALCSMGLPRITVDGNMESMIDQNDQLLLQLHAVETEFSDSHTTMIGILTTDESVLTPATIALIQHITEAAWSIPFAYRVDSVTNFQHTKVDGDDLQVGDLFPTDIPLDDVGFAYAKQVSLEQPEVVNQLVSSDEKMAAIHVSFNLPEKANYDRDVATITAYINEMLVPYRSANPSVEWVISGKVALDYGMQYYIQKDGSALIPLMLLLMIVILFFLLHSVAATLGTILVVSLTGLATMGLVGWLQISLDAVTSLSPIVIMTLAVADAVHINTGVISGLNKGMSKNKALHYSIRQNAWPVFLTSLTTVLGVITFVFADLPTVQHLGMIIALGVAIAFILSLTLLPAVLALLPMSLKTSRLRLMSFMPLAEWVIHHYKKILPVAAVVCIVLAILAPQNEINESPELFFKSWTAENKAIGQVNAHMAGMSTIDFALYSGQPGAVATPAFLATLEAFSGWLKNQNGVGHVKTIGDTFKQLNKNMHADNAAWYKQPESRELAAQYLLLYELSLPYGLGLNNQVNIDKSGVRITVTTKHLHAADKLALKYHAFDWFAEHAPHMQVIATGHSTIMEQVTIERLMPSMLRGGVIALVMVSLVLFIVLRSWKLGLIGMLANVMPVVMGYGMWSQINGIANFAVLSVAGICLGVVVDFAVHFLTKYRSARVAGNSAEDAVRFAFEKIGFPLWTTTIVLVSGFWLLTLSAINLNAGLGLLTGIIIILTLLFDFLVLPALLLATDKKTYSGEMG